MAWDTYDQGRQAEDVVDEIYIISPVDNPICSMSATVKASGKFHEFTEDSLIPAEKNAAIEGDDAPDDFSQAVVERGNYCQIMTKRASVSGSLESVDKYGRESEMLYQLEMRYSELANDEEYAVVGAGRQAGTQGAKGTAREMTSLQGQIAVETTKDAAAFTTIEELEGGILDAHEALYAEGGKPTFLAINPAGARYISKFANSAGRQRDFAASTELVDVFDILVNPYGRLEIILDRNLDPASMLLLDFNYLKTPILRPTVDWELARTGDSVNRQILRESTYALHNQKACGMVDNIPVGLVPAAQATGSSTRSKK